MTLEQKVLEKIKNAKVILDLTAEKYLIDDETLVSILPGPFEDIVFIRYKDNYVGDLRGTNNYSPAKTIKDNILNWFEIKRETNLKEFLES